MKKESKNFSLILQDYYEQVGEVENMNVVMGKHEFKIHFCGSKECYTFAVPFEKYEAYN